MAIKEVRIITDDEQEFVVVPVNKKRRGSNYRIFAETYDKDGEIDTTYETESKVVFEGLKLLKESCPNFWIDCDEGYSHSLQI